MEAGGLIECFKVSKKNRNLRLIIWVMEIQNRF